MQGMSIVHCALVRAGVVRVGIHSTPREGGAGGILRGLFSNQAASGETTILCSEHWYVPHTLHLQPL